MPVSATPWLPATTWALTTAAAALGLEEAVRRAVDGVVQVVGMERLAEEKIKEALDVAKGYKPMVKQPNELVNKGKTWGAGWCKEWKSVLAMAA